MEPHPLVGRTLAIVLRQCLSAGKTRENARSIVEHSCRCRRIPHSRAQDDDEIWVLTWEVTFWQRVELEQGGAWARYDTWRHERCGSRNTSLREILLRRQKGSENPSDLGTKHLDQATLWEHVAALGFRETRWQVRVESESYAVSLSHVWA